MKKTAKKLGEDGKVGVRNVRRQVVEEMKKLQKAAEVSDDQAKDGSDSVQAFHDKALKDIDQVVADKEKDLMTI